MYWCFAIYAMNSRRDAGDTRILEGVETKNEEEKRMREIGRSIRVFT